MHYLTLDQLAAAAIRRDLIVVEDPSLPDLFYRVEGDQRRYAINLASGFFNNFSDPGHYDLGHARITGDYTARAAGPVDGDLITIEADTFEIDDITTDSTDDTAGGAWNNVDDPLTVYMDAATYPVIGQGGVDPLEVGDLIYIDAEYFRVTAVHGNDVTFKRAVCGSAIDFHLDAADIYISVAPHSARLNGYIGIGTQAAAGPVAPADGTVALAATINDQTGTDANNVLAESWAAGFELMIYSRTPGTLGFGTVAVAANFAWDLFAMDRGASPHSRQVYATFIVIEAAEVGNNVRLALPFDPALISYSVFRPGIGVVAWDGMIDLLPVAGPLPGIIVFTDSGAVNFAASDVLNVLVVG